MCCPAPERLTPSPLIFNKPKALPARASLPIMLVSLTHEHVFKTTTNAGLPAAI